jgi:hypothetical protein
MGHRSAYSRTFAAAYSPHRAPQQPAVHVMQAPLDRATISTVMVPAKL